MSPIVSETRLSKRLRRWSKCSNQCWKGTHVSSSQAHILVIEDTHWHKLVRPDREPQMVQGRPLFIESQVKVMPRAFERESRYLAMLERASERVQNGFVRGRKVAVDVDVERL